MSAARRLRRQGVTKLHEAVTQVQSAVQALSGTTELPKVIKDLEEQTARLEMLANALADDYETLSAEIEIQREVSLRLQAVVFEKPLDAPLDAWRRLESTLRMQVMSEREEGRVDGVHAAAGSGSAVGMHLRRSSELNQEDSTHAENRTA
jgi:hypothetical protein